MSPHTILAILACICLALALGYLVPVGLFMITLGLVLGVLKALGVGHDIEGR